MSFSFFFFIINPGRPLLAVASERRDEDEDEDAVGVAEEVFAATQHAFLNPEEAIIIVIVLVRRLK
jgi:hypothetical protein